MLTRAQDLVVSTLNVLSTIMTQYVDAVMDLKETHMNIVNFQQSVSSYLCLKVPIARSF